MGNETKCRKGGKGGLGMGREGRERDGQVEGGEGSSSGTCPS